MELLARKPSRFVNQFEYGTAEIQGLCFTYDSVILVPYPFYFLLDRKL
jgi:hypothetical protein